MTLDELIKLLEAKRAEHGGSYPVLCLNRDGNWSSVEVVNTAPPTDRNLAIGIPEGGAVIIKNRWYY